MPDTLFDGFHDRTAAALALPTAANGDGFQARLTLAQAAILAGVTTSPDGFIERLLQTGLVSGLMPPGAPLLWFDANNIDGTNNSSLIDGQTIGTWNNLGSIGSAGNLTQATAGLRPIYRAIAAAGKINNRSGVDAVSASRFMATANSAFSVIAQPNIWYVVMRANTSQAGGGMILDSVGATNRQQWALFSLQQRLFATTAAVLTQTLTVNKWQTIAAQFNDAASFTRMDGTQQTVPSTPGTAGPDSLILMAGQGGTAILDGMIAEVLGYGSTSPPTPAQIETYLATKYGSTPQ